jgi:hypothetical protein
MKCSKHQEKDAVAMCDKCNLSYCGDCTLSSNGRCPACGKALVSPEAVLMGMSPEEMHRNQDVPTAYQAINSLYLEPVRTIRRLMQNASLFTGVVNITIVYMIMTLVRLAAVVALLVFIIPMTSGGAGIQSAYNGRSEEHTSELQSPL